uniref:sialin-like isoform X2 n=1 Tax=Myxine glutinosa TaxID=7769 RepID=UPI00358F8B18
MHCKKIPSCSDSNSSTRISEVQDCVMESAKSNTSTAPLLWSARGGLAVLVLLGCLVTFSHRVSLSVAIVAMVNHSAVPMKTHHAANSCPDHPPANISAFYKPQTVFNWDRMTQGLILGSFFYGYAIMQVPAGLAAERWGPRIVFGISTVMASIVTLVTPFVAHQGPLNLMVARGCLGLAQGALFPSMHCLWSKWAPPFERGGQIGILLTLSLSGLLTSYFSWEVIFYILGVAGLLWTACWFAFAHDDPMSHPHISSSERKYILFSTKSFLSTKVQVTKPWRAIATSLPVWAIIIAQTSFNWSFFTIFTTLPIYMDEILHFNLRTNGVLSALPYLFCSLTMILSAPFVDWLLIRGIFSITAVRKGFTTVGLLGPATCFFAVTYVGCSQVAAVTLFTLSTALGGLSLAGFNVNHLDIAPRFAGLLVGLTTMFGTIPGILGPTLMGALTWDHSQRQWMNIFYITSAVSAFGAIFYLLFASGEEQAWAQQNRTPSSTSPSTFTGNAEQTAPRDAEKPVTVIEGKFTLDRL